MHAVTAMRDISVNCAWPKKMREHRRIPRSEREDVTNPIIVRNSAFATGLAW